MYLVREWKALRREAAGFLGDGGGYTYITSGEEKNLAEGKFWNGPGCGAPAGMHARFPK